MRGDELIRWLRFEKSQTLCITVTASGLTSFGARVSTCTRQAAQRISSSTASSNTASSSTAPNPANECTLTDHNDAS